MGGDKYIKSIHTALPQIPLIAAGGVNQHTAANFMLSGATAIGVGAELIPSDAIAHRQHERIRELASRFVGFVKESRERMKTMETRIGGRRRLVFSMTFWVRMVWAFCEPAVPTNVRGRYSVFKERAWSALTLHVGW